jgi:hypothetical protein
MTAGYSDTLARLEHFFRSKCQTGGDDLDEGEVEMVEGMLAEAYSASQAIDDVGDVVVNEQVEELESPFGSQVEFSQGSQGYNPVEALKKYREHYAKDVRPPPEPQERRVVQEAKPIPELISTMTSQEVFSTALHLLEADEQLRRERREKERERIVQVEATPKEELLSHTEPPKVPVKMVTKTANAIMNILGGAIGGGSEETWVVEPSRPHHTFKPAIPETITIPTVVVTPLEDARLPSVMAMHESAAHIDLTEDKEEPKPEPVRKPVVNPPFVFDGHVGSESAAKRTRTFNKPTGEPESPLAIRELPKAPVVVDMPKIEVSVTPLAPVASALLSPQGIAIAFVHAYF